MAHTPTPWRIADGRECSTARAGEYVILPSQDRVIDWTNPIAGAIYSADNAALIVRAVNAHEKLLEALQRLLTASEDYASSEPDMPSHKGTETIFDEALINARAAIAEATA